MKRRLFAGIDLPSAARTACGEMARRVREAGFEARYVPPGNFHVTLAFFGNVPAASAEEAASALAAAGARCEPFRLTFDRLGAFPNERRPRIVYIGSRKQGAPFRSLAAAVREGFAFLGRTFEDDAVAHVTIARVKAPARPMPILDVPPIPLDVERIALFESLFDVRAGRSRYDVIATAPLCGVSAA